MNPRSLAKHVLERALARAAARVPHQRSRRFSLIVAYHNVLPPGARPVGDTGLHVPFDTFRRHLDLLQGRANLVPLDVALSHSPVPNGRPTVAITFDDGYRGTVETGLAELRRRDVPAAVFVCPGLAAGDAFWWDALSNPQTGSVDPSVRCHALGALDGRQERIRDWAQAQNLTWREMPEHCRIAGEDALRRTATGKGVVLGAHTWSHANLGALTPDAVRAEAARALEWLQARGLTATRALAYPYGIPPRDPEVAIPAAGCSHGLLVSGGWYHGQGSDAWRIPRYNVPAGLSADGFQIRLAGWMPHCGTEPGL